MVKSSVKRLLWAFLPLAALILLPALLREKPPVPDTGTADTLVILTPHAESIKSEFERAFQRYYYRETGRNIRIDWRSPGGTSDIVRYINDRYEAAFRHRWEAAGEVWSDAVAAGFRNAKLKPDASPGAPADARARRMFLDSGTSIGVDLFFGGGTYDHANQARKGYAVDCGIARRHPEWFRSEIIPERWSGETIYDPEGGYCGVCLATFGICANPDRLREIGVTPKRWSDLGEREFYNAVALADPTKSGSINKCFEVILQQCMAEAARHDPVRGPAVGWRNGMNLIRRMTANSRTISDSAGKVTREVASGSAAVGMAIDFYALSEAQYADFQAGKPSNRIVYIPPEGGSSVSADPVQLLRGAPHPEAARLFLDFLLSEAGQQIWEYRAGTPGGPEKYTLRRPPVRRDLYRGKHREFMTDPDYDPYAATGDFQYRADWTGRYFNLIRVLIRTTMFDAADELKEAWRAILAAGGPEAVPEAMKIFEEEIVPYEEAARAAASLVPSPGHPMEKVIAVRREWTRRAIRQYQRAAAAAKAAKQDQ